jgi:hypothetical protein
VYARCLDSSIEIVLGTAHKRERELFLNCVSNLAWKQDGKYEKGKKNTSRSAFHA